jgi:hypothetical protein
MRWWSHFVQTGKGHERIEERSVHAFDIEPLRADFPFARDLIVMRSAGEQENRADQHRKSLITCRTARPRNIVLKTGWS